MRKLLQGLLVTAGVLAFTGSATAGTLVPSWDWTVKSEFLNFSPLTVDSDIAPDDDGSMPITVLRWGTPVNVEQSRLILSDALIPANNAFISSGDGNHGTININPDGTPDGFEQGHSITHDNFVINGDSLESTELRSTVSLSPSGMGGMAGLTVEFDIAFEETPNGNIPPACPDDAFLGGLCGDIFALTGVTVNGNPVAVASADDLSFSFVFDGYLYTLDLALISGFTTNPFIDPISGLFNLSDAACSQAGTASGCVGFTTQENLSTTLTTFVQLNAVEIPEPAAIGLLGLGLLGLGVMRRRRIQ